MHVSFGKKEEKNGKGKLRIESFDHEGEKAKMF